MAYINQERKAKLAANLKKVIPEGWKYSLSVRNHSTIVLTIASAPVDLIGEYVRVYNHHNLHRPDYQIKHEIKTVDVNHFWLHHQFDEHLATFEAINNALNDGNHDNSDIQTDYFDVGWYVEIRLGRWDKAFVNTSEKVAA